MYHLGKILRIFGVNPKEFVSADGSFQAQLEMWDGNQVIVLVHPGLQTLVKENDFVLVRYAQPEPTIWKILKPKQGKELWDNLTDYLSQKKLEAQNKAQYNLRADSGLGKMIG